MKVDTLIRAVRKLETRSLVRSLSAKEERQLGVFCEEAWNQLLYRHSDELFGTQKVVGKHKLPRYMYHITTEESWRSMLKDGKIKPFRSVDSPAGIFLFDIKNFTRFWRKTKNVAEQPRTTLLNMIAGFFQTKANVVMLRIPTAELDARTIRIRRQDLCRCGNGNTLQELESCMQDKFTYSNSLKGIRYIMQGESVANVPKYNQKKLAIEYITPQEIPIENVKLVGKAEVLTEALDKAHKDMVDVTDIWKKLTQGSPEHKAFEHMI